MPFNKETKMPTPYIGITDFTSVNGTRMILDFFSGLKFSFFRRLMIGVMASAKTLHGLPSNWSNIFPQNSELREIFVNHPLAFNVLHYADYDGRMFASSLDLIARYSGPQLQGIQFDMVWPDCHILNDFKAQHPELMFVLQCGRSALQQLDNNESKLVIKLRKYEGVVDYVLFDESMGRGKSLNVDNLRRYLQACYDDSLAFSFAVAGGLGPGQLLGYQQLLVEFPGLSCDAQGRLRESHDCHDPINWDLAKAYLQEAAAL